MLSFILMVALNPVVRVLQKRLRVSQVMGILLAYVLVALSFGIVAALLIPPLAKQVIQLVTTLNIPFLQERLSEFNFTLQELSSLINNFGGSVSVVLGAVSTTFNSFFTIITLFIMSFYITLERPRLYKKVMWFTKKEEHLEKVRLFIDSVEFQLGGWVRAQAILMIVIFGITYTSLLLMGVPYALPLALLAGLLEIVPNLGPTIALFPAVIVAYLTFGPIMAGIVFILYILIQQFENSYLVPKVMQDNANVNPLISITAMLIGLTIAGFVGALLSIPVYIVLRSLFAIFVKPSFETEA